MATRQKITRNAAQCVKCGDIIESNHKHDFVSCSCDAIFVDGGMDYIRIGGNLEDIILMTEYQEKP
jgi:predicted phosphodiesterase